MVAALACDERPLAQIEFPSSKGTTMTDRHPTDHDVGTAHDHSHEQTASCSCGHDHAALPTRVVAAGESDIVSQIRTSALNAVFGATPARRAVLRALGLTTALAAV